MAGRHFHKFAARKIVSRDAARLGADIFHTASRHNLAAVNTRTRTDVHKVVRLTHSVLIVFHHNQGIAQIAQTLHGCNQFIVIPLVKSDARLIQNIQHSRKSAADLRCKADALTFSA